MMESLKTWIIGITVASMLLGAADTMVTQSRIKRVLRLAGSMGVSTDWLMGRSRCWKTAEQLLREQDPKL